MLADNFFGFTFFDLAGAAALLTVCGQNSREHRYAEVFSTLGVALGVAGSRGARPEVVGDGHNTVWVGLAS